MKKVLFLDIDGVVNSVIGFRERGYAKPDPFFIEPHLAIRLKSLISKIEPIDIVLSSTWRFYKTNEEMSEMLGVKIVDSTPRLFNRDRGHEITLWLEDNECDLYVILDDNTDMTEKHIKRLVQTNSEFGLRDEDVAEVIKKFDA